MSVPLLDLTNQYRELKEESDALWHDVMSHAAYIGGSRVQQLEEEIAAYCGSDYCVACANGTDALFLIMEALGIGAGDEVITTPWTFFATAECVVHVGAVPVFVDIEPGTYNIDVSKIEEKITAKTKAILPVHIYGQTADMDAINAIASRHNLVVIEDACQAIGASYKGKRAGNLARVAAFSFFPTKNLGAAGDAGCVTTNDKNLAERMRLLARHGEDSKYHHSIFGENSRMDALQAGLLSLRLTKLDEWNAQRKFAAAYYREQLSDIKNIELPRECSYGDSVYHLFIVKSEQAPRIVEYLSEKNVGSALYYPKALHEQEVFSQLPNWEKPHLPIAEDAASKTFALPCYPGITRQQQDEAIVALRSFFA
jgi:dTDP-4-amino-4,6-dideoxygalactose transaminase